MNNEFETEKCSRCRGSGKYSYGFVVTDVCFKCAGKGVVFTKRGFAAYRFYIESCEVLASEIKVGDTIQKSGITNDGRRSFAFEAIVTNLKRSTSLTTWASGDTGGSYYALVIHTVHPEFGESSLSIQDGDSIRIYRSDDPERFCKALEYQALLTKSGTIRKSKSKKELK